MWNKLHTKATIPGLHRGSNKCLHSFISWSELSVHGKGEPEQAVGISRFPDNIVFVQVEGRDQRPSQQTEKL